ncbi:MAG TPA: hypothetical protein VGX24_03935 [Pyrinomonadaceae bacterium]|jgi:hypothetical protein|nr:hypothetical protein [Pyrinomonadaceae bacterium]
MRHLAGIIFLVALAALPAVAKSGDRIQEVDFRNFSYPFEDEVFGKPLGRIIKVRGGKYDEPHVSTNVQYRYFRIAEVLYGDVTGDGQAEAAVVAIFGSASGTFYKTDIYVYTLRGRRAKLLAVLKEDQVKADYRKYFSGEGQQIFEATEGGRKIRDGRLIVRHMADGGHCCPEKIVTLTYRLSGKRMALAESPLRREPGTGEIKMRAYYHR